MAPKKGTKLSSTSLSSKTNSLKVNESIKNSIVNMFDKIKSKDQTLKLCTLCNQKIKSCLYQDHVEKNCLSQVNGDTFKNVISATDDDDVIILDSNEYESCSISKTKVNILKTEAQKTQKSIESVNINENNSLKLDENFENDFEALKPKFKRHKSDHNIICESEVKELIVNEVVEASINLEDQNEKAEELILNDYLNNIDESDLIKISTQSKETTELLDSSAKKNEDEMPNEINGTSNFDYYLDNFTNALQSVITENTFSCLLNQNDIQIVENFSLLQNKSKILYVRLFQRKFKWLKLENIAYDRIANDLSIYLSELLEKSFLIDENMIESYEEVLYQLKLPQLKEIAKLFHVTNQTQSTRAEYINALLKHFKTQRSLKFQFIKKVDKNNEKADGDDDNKPKPQYMNQCKKLLGKCYKLNKEIRETFVRILMLYSLSSTHHVDPRQKEAGGQQQLLQLLMINLGKVTYAKYEIKLNIQIFQDRDALIRYQESLDQECELLSFLDAKEFDLAFEAFESKIHEFRRIVLDKNLNEHNSLLPIYLRQFTASSIYCKIISLFAYEVLQKLRKYQEANQLFEFLLFEQNLYLQTSRPKWFERLALNYESHLKNPIKSFEYLIIGLKDAQWVKRAGRLALHQRLVKMAQTKRYLKIKELKDVIQNTCIMEKFDFQEAPTVQIEGTILHSEYIPGRKNIFIQNFESNIEKDEVSISSNSSFSSEMASNIKDSESNHSEQSLESVQSQQTKQKVSDVLVKNRYGISVEQVALTHYIKNLEYTNGKHAETSIITTLFGMLFWDIVFDNSVYNVFIDKFQSAPLDLQTDHFYANRKESIDFKLDLLNNSPIEFICELYSQCWNLNKNIECYLVNWNLFESLEELLTLVRCFTSKQLTSLCQFMSQNYRYCRSGGPDLIVWTTKLNKCKFVEVKGPGDRLSYKQMMWLDFMIKNSIECEVCYVKGQNSKRLRE